MLQPNDFIDWLCTMERVFKLKDVSDDKRVNPITIKAEKHASILGEPQETMRKRRLKQDKDMG